MKIAAVFSPPAEGNPDVRQIQEDLSRERVDNKHDPEGKKTALSEGAYRRHPRARMLPGEKIPSPSVAPGTGERLEDQADRLSRAPCVPR